MSTEARPGRHGDHDDLDVGMDGALADALVRSRRFFTKGTVSSDLRTLSKTFGPHSAPGMNCFRVRTAAFRTSTARFAT